MAVQLPHTLASDTHIALQGTAWKGIAHEEIAQSAWHVTADNGPKASGVPTEVLHWPFSIVVTSYIMAGALAMLFMMFRLVFGNRQPTGSTLHVATLSATTPPFVGKYYFEAAAACKCKEGKQCRAGLQSWHGPDYQALDCGEDSFFLTRRVIGVADGVTATRSAEQDPSILANSLMQFAQEEALRCETAAEIDPVKLIRLAYDQVEAGKMEAGGAATILIASLTQDGELVTANLGDSALMVVRDNAIIYKTEETEWQFNVPYMLEASSAKHMLIPSGRRNVPEDSAVGHVTLQDQDVIILASDGLWDNLYPHEILKLLDTTNDKSVAGLTKLIQSRAVQASQNRYKRSPFMVNAAEAGIDYQGGKPDDCTVVLARVHLAQ